MLTQQQLIQYGKDSGVSTKMVQVKSNGLVVSLCRARKSGITIYHFDLEESITQCLAQVTEHGPGTITQRIADKISDILGM